MEKLLWMQNIILMYRYFILKYKFEPTINNDELNDKIVLAFDKNTKFTEEEYKELIQLLKDYEIYSLITREEMIDIVEKIKLLI